MNNRELKDNPEIKFSTSKHKSKNSDPTTKNSMKESSNWKINSQSGIRMPLGSKRKKRNLRI